MEKYLQSYGFKLSSFLSDIFGVSGRTIIDHIPQYGQIDPDKTRLYLKGKAKLKLEEIKIAVNGKLNKHQK